MAAAGQLVYLAQRGMEGCSQSANSRVRESDTLATSPLRAAVVGCSSDSNTISKTPSWNREKPSVIDDHSRRADPPSE